MSHFPPRNPAAKVGGIMYFGRMIDKIRVHAEARLPAEYQPNLGKGFDANCLTFLRVDYAELVDRVKTGGADEEILQWCFEQGREPDTDEIAVWNEFSAQARLERRSDRIPRPPKERRGNGEPRRNRDHVSVHRRDEGRPLPTSLRGDESR